MIYFLYYNTSRENYCQCKLVESFYQQGKCEVLCFTDEKDKSEDYYWNMVIKRHNSTEAEEIKVTFLLRYLVHNETVHGRFKF